jgi:hypothetical protein
MLAKIKNLINPVVNDLIIAVVIVLVALIGFGLGRLSKIKENKTPLTVENAQNNANIQTLPALDAAVGEIVVASKNGTKYHYLWCSGATAIKEENKIQFNSTEEARKAGYQPASNCKGLK